MIGRESNGTCAGSVPGQGHFPLPKERRQRLLVLADLARRGLYCPDYEKLANALIDKEPELFRLDNRRDSRLDNLGAESCPAERERKDGAKGFDRGCAKDDAKDNAQEAPSPGENSR